MHDLYGDIKISACISTSEFSGSMLEKLKKFVAAYAPQITELPKIKITDTCEYSYFIAVAQEAMSIVYPEHTSADRWDSELLLHCYKIYTLGWRIISSHK
jgi:hypothetical protein